ncbi:MAG TPA: DNA polymerase/3'-5' exonuclease PolX [Gaiellaceae bacterium]|nr:DNA polymerase/3'-5' exonuclease PolX [Gaiellaceae bacterium]
MADLPRNAEIADQFDLLADLLELEGSDSFRVAAYRRAAARVRETAGSVAQLALEGRATRLPGIGRTIQEKIVQIVERGEIETLTAKKAAVPPEVVLFTKLPGLGPKTAARIWRELGIETLEELKAAAEGERLRTLAGLGPKSEAKILAALAARAERPEPARQLLGTGLPAVQAVVAALRELPEATAVSEAGSVRRRKETFRDLDVIAAAADPAALTARFAGLSWVADVAAHGDTKATVVSRDGLRFDLRVVAPESFGNLLQHFTGSKAHNVAMREEAVRRGLSISEYGVTTTETGEVFRSPDEDAVYEFLGYQPIPPELRENAGELEAARRGALPRLVELADVRGDLHTHSHWSADGKSTLEEMLAGAVARGYEYYAVTDHSHYLRGGRLQAQLEEIERLRGRFPGLRILAGVEANIRTNGEVDVPEEDLAQLDWVVASVHQAPDSRPTERVLEAMRNPYVDCIGHLTGRRIGRRPPRDVDVERVLEGALETGTFLEVNGQPDRLDLRDVHARAAKEAGVKLVVSSDAHEVRAQAYLELAVAQARRGWLTKEDVANTRTWRQLDRLRRRRPR